MGRRAKQQQKRVEVGSDGSDDELPEPSPLLKDSTRHVTAARDPKARSNPITTSPRRSSPRRRGPAINNYTATSVRAEGPATASTGLGLGKGLSTVSRSASTITLPPPILPVQNASVKGSPAKSDAQGLLSPVKRSAVRTEDESGAATSMQQRQRTLKLAHVNSLLLPLSRVARGGGGATDGAPDGELGSSWGDGGHDKGDAGLRPRGRTMTQLPAVEESRLLWNVRMQAIENDRAPNARRASPKRPARERAHYVSRLVLKEARCNDESDDSGIDNDENEDVTDLSGFIVDDDAELSFHDSDSGASSDVDMPAQTHRRKELPRKRRLRRGRNEARARMESEDEDEDEDEDEEEDDDDAVVVIRTESINPGETAHDPFGPNPGERKDGERRVKEIEVIDLTYSPPKAQLDGKPTSTTRHCKDVRPSPKKGPSSGSDPSVSSEDDHLLKFSPPRLKSSAKAPRTLSHAVNNTENHISDLPATGRDNKRCTTPPTTPPASPTKLKSPSKQHLLSPSKRGAAIPAFPHRQSIDTFWSSDVINTWNDQYSPRKPPLTVSPKKRGLARLLDFDIWSDSDQEDVNRDQNDAPASSSDPPTPTRSSSPSKAPESPSKLSSPSKRARTESKKLFRSTRHATAQSLFTHLDTHITSGQLSTLSASTGGVQIVWSKNLRSTAGRANWRRTVTRPASSPAKRGSEGHALVQHYASIELAEKVIDSDARLVNTLAHEFCHLANFMVSGVRDQPHGASFKAWAARVTTHLRTAPGLPGSYRAVEVTTKHNYIINHKYRWICAGTAPSGSAQAAARAFLALDEDPGCGAEYGRHSKSIDPEKHRCGKCKGLLVQVRPKPKVTLEREEWDQKGTSPRKGTQASHEKQRTGSRGGLHRNRGEGEIRSSDKLDGLEQALENVYLVD